MLWTDPESLRIWRTPHAPWDETLHLEIAYDDATLRAIREQGFTGIWVFATLQELMRSSVFPELNQPRANERREGIRRLIERASAHGLGVYLYFNEPQGLPVNHPFWQTHPGLRGVEKWSGYAFCTSVPQVITFFRDAVASVMGELCGLAGVILITACEALTHCWSKRNTRRGDEPPECPRCRLREPAEVVLELIQVWSELRNRSTNPWRILAWNWEWAYWYEDPQAAIVSRLPDGVELLLDMEIGGTRKWRDRANYVGEYSLAYDGPSQRLVATRESVRARGTPVHAKIELNNTHELCTVPNIPVIPHIHAKLRAMTDLQLAGFLGCWTMGCRATLNTAAMKLFMSNPLAHHDSEAFMRALARDYFGPCDTAAVSTAWREFARAFALYPFGVSLLYRGPHNDAPGRAMSLKYEGKPIGSSWQPGEPGDDLTPALTRSKWDTGAFTSQEIIDAYREMADRWLAAFAGYDAALKDDGTTEELTAHRKAERSCAAMIGLQLRATANAYRYHQERDAVMRENGLTAPCTLPRDERLLSIMRDELSNTIAALPLVQADARLGFHQDCRGYKYDAEMMKKKIVRLNEELRG